MSFDVQVPTSGELVFEILPTYGDMSSCLTKYKVCVFVCSVCVCVCVNVMSFRVCMQARRGCASTDDVLSEWKRASANVGAGCAVWRGVCQDGIVHGIHSESL